ncbi:deoxyuridine 5'-triphosphate nucleotidohydrolase [Halarchaeum grantii]|uniref:Deoxyuridine 5'-triphosphate nucleotidohydrolase n=1 Tax=Halarchaeum grantii TaxID=1193105 RepID=A0A830EXM9_9EURY|nr:deoxyuridine 5'-triphosphate nucleotidohydrolase [Halarchaeum grantii]GGL34770.1 deoxyuridine 5'-triphosphate nucleotidohydrolase [Halarchaeum grantii]
MFESGAFVADALGDVTDEQVQPNGVDLTLGSVEAQTEPGRITTDGKTVGERDAVETVERDGRECYALDPGYYVAQYAETVRVPEGHVGFVYPRSSLMRNSCMLHTAVWDAGYEGKGEGLLEVGRPIEIEVGARFAQFVLAEAEHEDAYDGSYQGERLD